MVGVDEVVAWRRQNGDCYVIPQRLRPFGLIFALMARGKHHEAAEVLLTGEAMRLESNERGNQLKHRKPCHHAGY